MLAWNISGKWYYDGTFQPIVREISCRQEGFLTKQEGLSVECVSAFQ